MPPKKSKKRKKPASMPGPYAIAMANLGKVAYGYSMAEEVSKPAFMAGRQKEAKDAYEGAGYSFDITEVIDMPKLEPGHHYRLSMIHPILQNGSVDQRQPVHGPAQIPCEQSPFHHS
jgi:hypothetical protein